MTALEAKMERILRRVDEASLDLRDRSEPEQLRRPAPAPAPARPSSPAPAPQLDPIQLDARHAEPLDSFACPRCGEAVAGAAFYGPCATCCAQLRGGATVQSVPPLDPAAPADAAGAAPVLRRQQRRHRARPTVCRSVTATVAELLHELPAGTERVYLVGPRPGLTSQGDRDWFLGELPDGWSHHEAGHFLSSSTPVGKYQDPAGLRVEVHRAASWLGDGDYTAALGELALGELAQVLEQLGTKLLATPATTGRQLLLATIPEREQGWAVLSMEDQDLIRSTSGQGRIEMFAADEPGQLHEYDGRWYYAALCWGLGTGPAVHDEQPTWDPYARGRYRVRFTVPSGWEGPGLLGTHEGEGWAWPSTPGSTWTTWADGSELLVAQRAGWTFTVLERLVLTDGKANPLGVWAERIVAASEGQPPLVRGALRKMLLSTIGSLHGRPFSVTKVAGLDQLGTIPAEAPAQRRGQQVVWEDQQGQAWPAMAHPEWTAAIWARGRARLLSGPGSTGALHLDAGRLVAMRTDALYVTARQPSWERADDGKVGRLTYKGGRTTTQPQPTSSSQLLAQRTWRSPA